MSLGPLGTAWQLAFQLSPIILTNGIAGALGGYLPIIAITELVSFPLGLLTGGTNVDLDSFFFNFRPLVGASLIDQDLGRYPFANQAVAANAVIQQPLVVSLQAANPVNSSLGYAAKLATITLLQTMLLQHNQSGGTYIVLTPSYIYTNCILRTFRDTSTGESKQAQNTWQFDFEQPLLTLAAAQAAQNNLFQLISGGLPVTSVPGATALASTTSLATPSILPVIAGSSGPGSIATSALAPLPGFTTTAAALGASPP